jgi:hypothetical protein
VIRVFVDRKEYDLVTDIQFFANWVNGIPEGNVLLVDDFKGWQGADGKKYFIDRLSVTSAFALRSPA